MKKEINNYPLIHPTTIVVVGTMLNDKANFTTIGDIAVAGLNPALIMISINANHGCMTAINHTQSMSVNIPTSFLLSKVDYCGVYSSKEVNKSKVFNYTLVNGCPIINEAPISLILHVEETIKIKQRVVMVCSVTKTFIDDSILTENKLDLSKIQPILYGLDNQYYSNITPIGKGYAEAKKYTQD